MRDFLPRMLVYPPARPRHAWLTWAIALAILAAVAASCTFTHRHPATGTVGALRPETVNPRPAPPPAGHSWEGGTSVLAQIDLVGQRLVAMRVRETYWRARSCASWRCP